MNVFRTLGIALVGAALGAYGAGCGSGDSGNTPTPAASTVKEGPAKGSTDTVKSTPATTSSVVAIVSATAGPSATVSAVPAASASGSASGKVIELYQANGFPTEMPKAGEKTPIPKIEEWTKAPVLTGKKLPDGCSMKFVREWLNIKCEKNATTGNPKKITFIKDLGTEGTDLFKLEKEGQMIDLVFRTVREKKGNAIFVTDKKSYKVGYDWPAGAPFPSTTFE